MSWMFLTNHAHVLICIAEQSDIRIRDIAVRVGITERAAQRIVADLAEAGYVVRKRVGRRNEYEVNTDVPLRHPQQANRSVGAIVKALTK